MTVLSASGLRAADVAGSSDPFCTCRLQGDGHLEFQTAVVKKSLNPEWNFRGPLSDGARGRVLEFEVFDWDRWTRNDILGKAALAISREPCGASEEFDIELPLRDPRSEEEAERLKAETQEMLKKLGKGDSEQFFRVSLVWKKAVDLDLKLTGPAGKCDFNNKKCRGLEKAGTKYCLDVDNLGSRQRGFHEGLLGSLSDRIENIAANSRLGDGHYLAEVELCSGDGPAPWEAGCWFDDGTATWKAGALTRKGETCTIAEFDVVHGKPVLRGEGAEEANKEAKGSLRLTLRGLRPLREAPAQAELCGGDGQAP